MKLMIIDGSHMLHRVMFTAPNADWKFFVFSFFRTLITAIEKFNEPVEIIVGWDKGRPKKAEYFEEYKANRVRDEEPPPEIIAYREARKFLNQWLPELGIASWLVEGYEADDMAMYATRIRDYEGRLVSDDYDWLLAMTPKSILYRPIKDEVLDWNAFIEMMKHENPYEVYRWTKAMIGDGSDNIPGVYGIGWGFGTKFARLLVEGKELPDSAKGKAVKENFDLVKRNYNLITLSSYNEEDLSNIENTFNQALDNRKFPNQIKWLEMCGIIKSETLPMWYDRLEKYLEV